MTDHSDFPIFSFDKGTEVQLISYITSKHQQVQHFELKHNFPK